MDTNEPATPAAASAKAERAAEGPEPELEPPPILDDGEDEPLMCWKFGLGSRHDRAGSD